MATQLNGKDRKKNMGDLNLLQVDVTLITSGTTITFTLADKPAVYGVMFWNKTTGALTNGGTYTQSTGVYVSPTMAVNDNAVVSLIVD